MNASCTFNASCLHVASSGVWVSQQTDSRSAGAASHLHAHKRTGGEGILNAFSCLFFTATNRQPLHTNAPSCPTPGAHPPGSAFSQPPGPRQKQSIALCLSLAHFSSVCDAWGFFYFYLPRFPSHRLPNVARCFTNGTLRMRHFSPVSQESNLS